MTFLRIYSNKRGTRLETFRLLDISMVIILSYCYLVIVKYIRDHLLLLQSFSF